MSTKPISSRGELLRQALRLEYLTVGWNLIEGVIAITASVASGSVALLGFGIDSFVESTSGSVLIWRLRAEQRHADAARIDRAEVRAQKLVAASLFMLAAYIGVDGAWSLIQSERPDPSATGIALASVSLLLMRFLASAKRRSAVALGSRAMEADAFQTTACWWLSLIVLIGIGANAAFGWWWADPLAAIAMTPLILKEARGAWRGEDACCD